MLPSSEGTGTEAIFLDHYVPTEKTFSIMLDRSD
jgi:hypothetical protein